MDKNNHEVFSLLRDISDGESHEDGIKNPELRAKADNTAVNKSKTDSLQTAVDNFHQQMSGDYQSAAKSEKKYNDIKSGKIKQTVGRGKSIIDRD